jgi:hypothetical protein
LFQKLKDFSFYRVDDAHTLLLLVVRACAPRFFKQAANKVTAIQKRLTSINLKVFGRIARSDGNSIEELGIVVDVVNFVLIIKWLCPSGIL